MARDDLQDPLGFAAGPDRETGRKVPLRAAALSACALLAFSAVAFALFPGDGGDGEPRAVASIASPKKPDVPPVAPAAAPAQAVSGETTGSIDTARRQSSIEEIETQSGVRIVRRGGGQTPGALIIQVPPSGTGVHLTPAPDKRLVEKGKHGPLPKIGADGARPADVYARPVVSPPGLRAGAPRIAILVGGLGLAAGPTQDAIDKLPDGITLGFAPYGPDLEKQAARARESGHEIMLQAPMEPFDIPQNDPGPHTLRTDADASQNQDDLHWLMARFPGYVGVANFLGARFTANRQALAPVLADIAARGLIYADDGASPQSVAASLAPGLDLAFVHADVVIDIDRRPESVAAALISLEALARTRGQAFGVASALPGSIDQINRFAQALEKRGVALVPVSALASRQPKATAERQ